MLFSIITLFPEMFGDVFATSILKRAQNKKLITVRLINIRDFATDAYKSVDDAPYGGGTGMILKVDVIDRALESAKNTAPGLKVKTVLLDPQGEKFTQVYAQTFTEYEHLILVCGHYEGVDARVNTLVDLRLSIGNYILTGGELPAIVVVDAVTRLTSGVLPKSALEVETFTGNKYEFPQYTRPAKYKGMNVPKILLSGHHEKILTWRRKNSQKIIR